LLGAAQAGDVVWQGDESDAWGTGGNWDTGAAPQAGDDAVFYASGAGNLDVDLGAANRTADAIRFSAAADSAVTLGNGTLTNGSGGIAVDADAGAAHAIACDVVLGADQTWDNASAQTLTVSGRVSGDHAIVLGGTGTVSIVASNAYTGGTHIDAGTLEMGHPSACGGDDTGNAGYFGFGVIRYLGATNGANSATLAFGDFSEANDRFGGPIVVRAGSSGDRIWSLPDPNDNSYGPMRPQLTLAGDLIVRIGNSGDDRWALSGTASVSGTGDLILEGPGILEVNVPGIASGHTGDWVVRAGILKLNFSPVYVGPGSVFRLGATNGTASATIFTHNNYTYIDRPLVVRAGSSGKKAIGTYWYTNRKKMGTKYGVTLEDDLWVESKTAGSVYEILADVVETNGSHKVTFYGTTGAKTLLQADGDWSGGTAVVRGGLSITNGGSLAHANISIGGDTVAAFLDGDGAISFETGEAIDVNALGTLDATGGLTFDLTALAAAGTVVLVDYGDSGTFSGPAVLDDMLSPASAAAGWTLTDTGSQVTAAFSGGTAVIVQ
jgi:autotransporter-associated beta strand protein